MQRTTNPSTPALIIESASRGVHDLARGNGDERIESWLKPGDLCEVLVDYLNAGDLPGLQLAAEACCRGC